MINAYPQNNMYGNAWWGIYPPYQTTPIAPQTTYSPQTQPQNTQPTGGIDGVAFVQGENAALAYVVPNGKTFLLIDTVEDRIYFKSADAYGRPSPLNDFWLTKNKPEASAESEAKAEETPAQEYVTREEFDELKERLGALAGVTAKKAGRPRKEETEVDE